MAIEVRIPTILRTYTDGAKQVEGSGSTLAELFTDNLQRWLAGRPLRNVYDRAAGY